MDDVLAEILGYLSTALTTSLKTYYKGEVVLVPQSYLPALMIFGNTTTIVAKSTAKDQMIYDITIRVVQDVKLSFKEAGTGTEIDSQDRLRTLIEDRNADGSLKTATVLGVLRANVRGTKYLFNNEISVQYKPLQQGEWFYHSAEINLTAITDLVVRP